MSKNEAMRRLWDTSFEEQIERQAFNTAPVEALARTVSYYLRDRVKQDELSQLHFLEIGCGAAPNLIWLAQKGIRVSGIDISPRALSLGHQNLVHAGFADRIGDLLVGSASQVPLEAESFDGVIEACVFQHLGKDDRLAAFHEVKRLLKPGGVFVGYMLDAGHTVFEQKKADQLSEDPGSLVLEDGRSNLYLTNIGLSHFFRRQELIDLFPGFSIIDPCLTTYYLPAEEARKRGYETYLQSMWTVYAVK